jgi:hypothetical protein
MGLFVEKFFTIDWRVFVVTNSSFFGIGKPVYLFLIGYFNIKEVVSLFLNQVADYVKTNKN